MEPGHLFVESLLKTNEVSRLIISDNLKFQVQRIEASEAGAYIYLESNIKLRGTANTFPLQVLGKMAQNFVGFLIYTEQNKLKCIEIHTYDSEDGKIVEPDSIILLKNT